MKASQILVEGCDQMAAAVDEIVLTCGDNEFMRPMSDFMKTVSRHYRKLAKAIPMVCDADFEVTQEFIDECRALMEGEKS